MKSEGRPLWNGTSELTIRPATEEETEIFEDALAEDDAEDEPFEVDATHAKSAEEPDEDDEEDEADIVFLLDIDEDGDTLDS
jgi:hypothetical protein